MDNNQRLQKIHEFLDNFEFMKKMPDFIGIWISNISTDSFNVPTDRSYMFGYIENEASYRVIDGLGISQFDNPFTTEGLIIQTYDSDVVHTTAAEESLFYGKTSELPNCIPQSFLWQWNEKPIFGTWYVESDSSINGIFAIIKRDASQEFQKLFQIGKDDILVNLRYQNR